MFADLLTGNLLSLLTSPLHISDDALRSLIEAQLRFQDIAQEEIKKYVEEGEKK